MADKSLANLDPAGSDRDKHVLLEGPQRRVRPSLGPV